MANRGTGAGGANTNLNGKTFEEKTENESRLIAAGFIRKSIPKKKGKQAYYLQKNNVVYLTQCGLKPYFKYFFKKNMARCPDEAYLFLGERNKLKILEKKNQNVAGSVDTKLLAGVGFKEEYEYLLGDQFEVHYGFCISSFLKKNYIKDSPKGNALRHINQKHGISVLFGDDDDYFETLDEWISS
jgi:hypothetical protein